MAKTFTPSFVVPKAIAAAFVTNNPLGENRVSAAVQINMLAFNNNTRSIEATCSDKKMRQCRVDRFQDQAKLRALTKKLQAALAVADVSSNTTLYTSSSSASALGKVVKFTLGPARVVIKAGNSDQQVFAIIRKLPEGYSAPTNTITDGNTVFQDVPNILAYGLIRVAASSTDPMNRIDLRYLQRGCVLRKGESVILQLLANAASTGATYSALVEYQLH